VASAAALEDADEAADAKQSCQLRISSMMHMVKTYHQLQTQMKPRCCATSRFAMPNQ
jgi:hypothetical protein